MRRFISSLYLSNRFFYLFGAIASLFVLAFCVRVFATGLLPSLTFAVVKTILVVAFAVVLLDILLLYVVAKVDGERLLPKQFSLGDDNVVRLAVINKSNLPVRLTIIDELPVQFQKRDFEMHCSLSGISRQALKYTLHPTERGEYHFHDLNVFVKTPFLGLVERRLKLAKHETIAVYPSVIQMKKYELMAFTRISTTHGIKKMRKIGHSYEFEQIRQYVKGDDYRSINWKATSRHQSIMVNQYEDERSQQVYVVIDKSRSMQMPFNGLSLLDYAVNTSLVISNIALKKQDRVGLLTFSDKIGTALKADNQPGQIRLLLDALYREQLRPYEANYELLYSATRHFIKRRSLLLLYTNFESFYAMQRVLPLLRRINRLHLLVVVFFENSEITNFTMAEAKTLEDVYIETTARRFANEKRRIAQELEQYGIQCIYTRPEDLSVNTVNKYLELKSRGAI